jgi:hypothetical protein
MAGTHRDLQSVCKIQEAGTILIVKPVPPSRSLPETKKGGVAAALSQNRYARRSGDDGRDDAGAAKFAVSANVVVASIKQ